MTEQVWIETCDCCEPPRLRVIATADRRIDVCGTADKCAALRDWIGAMIRHARSQGVADETIKADFSAAVETFYMIYSGVVDAEPNPTEYPVDMTWSDQLCCVLPALTLAPEDPQWFVVSRLDALECARQALNEGVAA